MKIFGLHIHTTYQLLARDGSFYNSGYKVGKHLTWCEVKRLHRNKFFGTPEGEAYIDHQYNCTLNGVVAQL